LAATIRREAYMMAYSDAFYLACLALIGCAVAALLLRTQRSA
jgi:DHA2 family multidrug resistance protein